MKSKNILILAIAAVFLTGFMAAIIAPKMHKPFQISIIEYIVKFNSDNSMTTTKKTTDYTYIREDKN